MSSLWWLAGPRVSCASIASRTCRDLPTIDAEPGASPARCVALAAEWSVPLTENRVKRATESGQLPRFIVCAKLRYSNRHVYRWLYDSTSGCDTR
jgi:hypothetical protein